MIWLKSMLDCLGDFGKIFLIILENKRAAELVEPYVYRADHELLSKAESQLMNALSLLESVQDGKSCKFCDRDMQKANLKLD